MTIFFALGIDFHIFPGKFASCLRMRDILLLRMCLIVSHNRHIVTDVVFAPMLLVKLRHVFFSAIFH